MKKTTLFIATLIMYFLCSPAHAQTGWQWGHGSKTIGGSPEIEAAPSAVDKSGNLIASGLIQGGDSVEFGSTYIHVNGTTAFVTKVDPAGNYLWTIGSSAVNTGGISAMAEPASIATDDTGNIYVLGVYMYTNQMTLGSFHLINDSTLIPMEFLAKISPSGTVLWAQNLALCNNVYGQSGFSVAYLGVDSNSNVYVIARFN